MAEVAETQKTLEAATHGLGRYLGENVAAANFNARQCLVDVLSCAKAVLRAREDNSKAAEIATKRVLREAEARAKAEAKQAKAAAKAKQEESKSKQEESKRLKQAQLEQQEREAATLAESTAVEVVVDVSSPATEITVALVIAGEFSELASTVLPSPTVDCSEDEGSPAPLIVQTLTFKRPKPGVVASPVPPVGACTASSVGALSAARVIALSPSLTTSSLPMPELLVEFETLTGAPAPPLLSSREVEGKQKEDQDEHRKAPWLGDLEAVLRRRRAAAGDLSPCLPPGSRSPGGMSPSKRNNANGSPCSPRFGNDITNSVQSRAYSVSPVRPGEHDLSI
jgi:hypothetical protein